MLCEEPGFNVRDYNDPDVIAQIENFAQAYSQGKFVPPPIVRFDQFSQQVYMVEGHLRRRGMELARSRGTDIPFVMCVPFKGNDADRVTLMVCSAQGLPLKPVGVARSYLKLINMGFCAKEIARKMNRSVAHIEDMLFLATANTDVQIMVSNNTVTQTNAIAAVKKYGDQAGKFLTEELSKAKSQGKSKVTASALKEWVPSAKLMRGIYDSAQPLISTLDAEALQVVAAATPSNISALKGKTLTVDAYAMAQFFLSMKEASDAKHRRDQITAEKIEMNKQSSFDS